MDYGKNRFGKLSGLKNAVREVERMISASAAKSQYYGTEQEELKEVRDRHMLIIEALKKSRIVTESAAFVWMVKTDDK